MKRCGSLSIAFNLRPFDSMPPRAPLQAEREYPPFIKAMRKRGIDVEKVCIDPWCPGYFSPADDPAKRLARCLPALLIPASLR